MTDLSELTAELRKAAKTYYIYVCYNCKAQLAKTDMGRRCGFCVNWTYEMDCKISVLPAVLVEQDLQRIKEEIMKALEDEIYTSRIKEKVEEAFK